MKKIIFTLFVLAIFYIPISAVSQIKWIFEGNINVGLQPTEIIKDVNGNYNVFCLGKDSLYDGIQQKGDVASSWWKLNKQYLPGNIHNPNAAQKIRDFEFGAFPWNRLIRPGVDLVNDMIYFCQFGRIRSYKLSTGELLEDTVANVDASGISISGDGEYMFFSVRKDLNSDGTIDTNYIVVYDRVIGEFADTIPAFGYVQMSIPYGSGNLAVLCEGTFGQNNSVLMFLTKNTENKYSLKDTINLGNGGNHIAIDQSGNYFAITVNGSRQVIIYDLIKNDIAKTIDIPVGDWDGPRETFFSYPKFVIKKVNNDLAIQSMYLLTSTYAGKVYYHTINYDSIIEDTLVPVGKTEGIISNDDSFEYVLASNQFIKDTYSPDSTVAVFFMEQNSVDYDLYSNTLKIYPNPINNNSELDISLDELIGISSISLYNLNGVKLFENNYFFPQNDIKLNLKELNLEPGTYFIKFKIDYQETMRKLIVN